MDNCTQPSQDESSNSELSVRVCLCSLHLGLQNLAPSPSLLCVFMRSSWALMSCRLDGLCPAVCFSKRKNVGPAVKHCGFTKLTLIRRLMRDRGGEGVWMWFLCGWVVCAECVYVPMVKSPPASPTHAYTYTCTHLELAADVQH